MNPQKNNPMQQKNGKTKKELVRERIQCTCFEIIKDELKNEKSLDNKDILFISSLFKLISDAMYKDPEMEPREHSVFCDRVAETMSDISGTETYNKEDVQKIVVALSEGPYYYVVTNDHMHFTDFRATDFFVDLICEKIGLEFY